MWRTLSLDDLLSAVTGPEKTAYSNAALQGGQADPVTTAIETAVKEGRAKIATCPHNRLAPGLTLPEEAIHTVIAIVRWRLLSRLPINGVLDTDARRDEYRTAIAEWSRWPECKPIFEKHGGDDDAPRSAVTTPRGRFRKPLFQRAQQDGI